MSNTLEILTAKEVYWISYITAHGWTPDYDCEQWKKEGHTRKVFPPGLYCCSVNEMIESEWFDLESAFWEEYSENNVRD